VVSSDDDSSSRQNLIADIAVEGKDRLGSVGSHHFKLYYHVSFRNGNSCTEKAGLLVPVAGSSDVSVVSITSTSHSTFHGNPSPNTHTHTHTDNLGQCGSISGPNNFSLSSFRSVTKAITKRIDYHVRMSVCPNRTA
jgi:hypothetical protein